jgi:hypothetical protein
VNEASSGAAPAPGAPSEGDAAYRVFAERVVAGGILRDPWVDGRPRFSPRPIVIDTALHRALCSAAEDVAAACQAMVALLLEEPKLLEDVLGLTPYQRMMWEASAPSWHGIARADVFVTRDGLAVAEINCDTPTGEAEAIVLGELAGDASGAVDPNTALGDRFLAMLEFVAARERVPDAGPVRTIGLVYPTELTDDLPLVRLYKRWFEGRGWSVVLGSPYNLTFEHGRTCLFDAPIDILLRHYKTDWWGERKSAWRDDPIHDEQPLAEPFRAVLSGMAEGRLAVVNPFGAVAVQNKRSFALMWEQIHRFPARVQETIEKLVPVTRRLEVMHAEQLFVQRAEWVLKSDYGAEGEEVVVGREVSDATWRQVLARAEPARWVAQRYFAAETDARGAALNYGVFLVAGKAAGLYGRVQVGATDARAQSASILVRPAR